MTGLATRGGRAALVMDVMARVGAAASGTTVMVPVEGPDDVDVVDAWCRGTGNAVLAVYDDAVEVYRGRLSDPDATLPADRLPGHRLWLYTNFHCNLACDYCCVSSSPQADPRSLDLAGVRRAVAEGVEAGVRELYLTGGEPFLHADIAEIVEACTRAAPTVLLTNAMLFRGSRLRRLDAMPRDGLLLQVSIDSPTPDVHDAHRGAGSWQRAVDGIATATALGFRVRLGATLSTGSPVERDTLAELAGRLGVERDLVVRRVAREGVASRGIVVSRATLVPEVCVTGDGVYWHPVAATNPAMKVSTRLSPLDAAIESVREEYLRYRRRSHLLAAAFPCA
ncbi:MAG: radical SAM protein [Frankiaceae bacterium]